MIRVEYGPDSNQFAELWLPSDQSSTQSLPVAVLVHGGFWKAQYGQDLMHPLAADLAGRGFAVWNIEYRRVTQPGGGYPGTLHDVATAMDSLFDLAKTYDLDLSEVSVVGHSAGGHLALWLAGRRLLNSSDPGANPQVVAARAIGLGPVVHLSGAAVAGIGTNAVANFIGATPIEAPDRYAIATPRFDSGVPVTVIRGTRDDVVPSRFTLLSPNEGIHTIDVDSDHMQLIEPNQPAWQATLAILCPPA